MSRDDILREYFDWICHFVYDSRFEKKTSYQSLMHQLFETDFEYILPMDGNRAEDGTDLRYRFAYENNYSPAMIARYLDDCPCSVLEMMVALAIRCEDHIMDDPEIGNRTGQWFWNMIVNLGLGGMTDSHYDEDRVDEILDIFMMRKYKRNGEGGLFKVDRHGDMRGVQIWYQMCLYLEDYV